MKATRHKMYQSMLGLKHLKQQGEPKSTRARRVRGMSRPRTRMAQDAWGATMRKTHETREHVRYEARKARDMWGTIARRVRGI